MCISDSLYTAAAAAGCRDYYLIGTVANILLLVGTAALTMAIARRLAGDQGALTALLIWAGMLPLYFYAPIFYSDTPVSYTHLGRLVISSQSGV